MWGLGLLSGLWAVVGFLIRPLRRADLLWRIINRFWTNALDLGFIDTATLWKGLKWQRLLRLRARQPWLLGDVMLSKGLISRDQHAVLVKEISNALQKTSTPPQTPSQEAPTLAHIHPVDGKLVSDDLYGLNLLGDIVVDLGFCSAKAVISALDQQVVGREAGSQRHLGTIFGRKIVGDAGPTTNQSHGIGCP